MGILFAFLSAFSYALSNILVKKGQKKDDNDNGFMMTLVINVIILGLIFLITWSLTKETFIISWQASLFFILGGVLTTGLGRFMLFSGIRRIGPSRSAAIKNGAPVFTVLFALLILGETVTVLSFLGLSLLITAILLQGIKLFKQNISVSKAGNPAEAEVAVSVEEVSFLRAQKVGYVIVVVSALCFGLGHGVRKQGLLIMNEAFFGAFLGAVTALLIFVAYEGFRGQLKRTLVRNFCTFNPYFVATGILSSFGPLFFFLGASITNLSYVGVIVGVEPILTLLVSILFFKQEEIITKSTWVTVLLVLIGTACIALGV